MDKKEVFLKEYIKAIRDGNAALFAGAGLSRPSGFVDWKELLRPFAESISLNIEDEHDLTLVAQYVQNASGNRGAQKGNTGAEGKIACVKCTWWRRGKVS